MSPGCARPRTTLLALSGALVLAASCAVSAPVPSPPQRPAALPAAATIAEEPEDPIAAKNRGCEDCHRDIAAEWKGSLHHQAWDDPVFLTAYSIEPAAFCRGCHVPEADSQDSTPPAWARRMGIGCVTCHVRPDEGIVGARGLAGTKDGHAVTGDARFETVEACARCHEFDFPEPQPALMQGTVSEHATSPHAKAPCRDCHMPLVAGGAGAPPHRSHDFKVIGNVALLRSAVTASADRSDEDGRTVVVTLATGRVGHAFPTGDMFRRIEVRARTEGEASPVLSAQPVILARLFVMAPGKKGMVRREVGDDRLSATGEARDVELVFPEAVSARAVRWEVAYQRMGPTMARMFGVDPAADEVIVADGVIPAAPRATP